MDIYDQQGRPLDEYDLDKGYLKTETHTVHHDAVGGVKEQGHWVLDEEYPETDGKDVTWVVDVPGVEAVDAWDEDVTRYVYIPYDEDVLRAHEKAKRILELKGRLLGTDYAIIKIAEGAATIEEYIDVIEQRHAWRDEINRLQEEE